MAGIFLIILGCTVAAIVVCYLTTAPRKSSGTDLGDRSGPSASISGGPDQTSSLKMNSVSPRAEEGSERVWGTGLTKLEAEDLLDWLEASGHKGELTFESDKGFTVR